MANPNPSVGFHTNPERINRKGAPEKEWTWAGMIKEAMEEFAEDGEPIKKKVSKSLILKALTGDVQAIKEIGDRIDGKAQQNTDITSGGEPLSGLIKLE